MTYRFSHVADSEILDIVDTDAYLETEQLSSEDCINLIAAECKGDPCLLTEIVENLDSPLYEDFEIILNSLVKITRNQIRYLTSHYDPAEKTSVNVPEFIVAEMEDLGMKTLRFLKQTGYFSDEVLETRVDKALSNPFLN